MIKKIKNFKLNKTDKIGLFISLYFITILILSALTYRNVYLDFLSPYPQNSGHISGDIAAFGIELFFILLGVVGLFVLLYSKRQTTVVFQVFLFLTSLSGISAITNLQTVDRNQVIFYALDIFWGIIGIIGIILLQINHSNKEKNKLA